MNWMRWCFYSIVFLGLFSSNFGASQATSDYDAAVHQGNAQLQAGNTDLALESGKTAIKLNAGRWEAYALAGGALMNLKHYEEATDNFSHAIERAPEAKQSALRNLRRQCLSAELGASAPTPPATASQPTSATTTQAEIVLWKSIENSSSPEDFQVYLTQYPQGAFAALASRRFSELSTVAKQGADLGGSAWEGTITFTLTNKKVSIRAGDQLGIRFTFDRSGQFSMDQIVKGQTAKNVMSGSWSVENFHAVFRIPAQGYRCAVVMEGTRRQGIMDGDSHPEGDTSHCTFIPANWNLRLLPGGR